jgi:hypothetical protein
VSDIKQVLIFAPVNAFRARLFSFSLKFLIESKLEGPKEDIHPHFIVFIDSGFLSCRARLSQQEI